MKNIITRTFTSIMIAVAGMVVAAPAQTNHTVKVSIPFEFSFGERTFPAGDYSLVQPLQNVMMLRDADGRTVAQKINVDMVSLGSLFEPRVTFLAVNGQHILTGVRDGEDSRRSPVQTKNRALAKHRSDESRAAAEGSQP